jgi:hypothetical protein
MGGAMTAHLHSHQCLHCHKVFGLAYDDQDYQRWKGGELIQRAMPYLTADQRELLISGVCGECFDKMFTPEEDEGG